MEKHADRWFFLLGVVILAAYLGVGHLFPADGEQLQWMTLSAVGLAAVITLFVRARTARSDAKPWVLIAIGLLLFVAGDFTYGFYANILHRSTPLVSVADLFYLGGYVVFALACLALVRSTGDKDTDSFLDAGIVAISGAIVMWAIGMTSNFPASGPLLGKMIQGAYPLGDIVLLGMLVRLGLTPALRSGALWFLLAGFGFFFLSDTMSAVLPWQTYRPATWQDIPWVLAYVAFGSASLHPRMRHMVQHGVEAVSQSLTWRRTVVLGAALLVEPIVLVARDSGRGASIPIASASTLVTILLLWRIARATRGRQHTELRLEFLAMHDPLTGLPNRSLLRDRLETAIARIERSEGFMAAIFLDLDGFKHVNDSLGHGLGDELLVEVARRLREAVRPSDTVARLGGDEFVVLAEDLASREDAFALATRLRMSLATPFERAELKLSLSASIGVAVENQPDANSETLLRRADMAMYQAKTLGRDRIEFFDPDDRQTDGTGGDPLPLAARHQRASTPAT